MTQINVVSSWSHFRGQYPAMCYQVHLILAWYCFACKLKHWVQITDLTIGSDLDYMKSDLKSVSHLEVTRGLYYLGHSYGSFYCLPENSHVRSLLFKSYILYASAYCVSVAANSSNLIFRYCSCYVLFQISFWCFCVPRFFFSRFFRWSLIVTIKFYFSSSRLSVKMLDGHSSGDLLLGGGGGAKVPQRKAHPPPLNTTTTT